MGSHLRRTRTLIVCGALGIAASAEAAPDGCEPVTAGALHAEIEAAQPAFALPLDLPAAAAALEAVDPLFACLDEPVLPVDVAQYARLRATLGFYAQDDAELTRWGHLALSLDPQGAWPQPLHVGHPLIVELLEAPPQAAPPPSPPLALPRGTTLFLNGQRVQGTPHVLIEVSTLVQLADRNDRVLYSAWQDGAAWPDTWPSPSKRVKEEVYKPPSRTAWDAIATVGASGARFQVQDRDPFSRDIAIALTERIAYAAPRVAIGGDVGGDRIGVAARVQVEALPTTLFAVSATAGPQLRVGERFRFTGGLTYTLMNATVTSELDSSYLLSDSTGLYGSNTDVVVTEVLSGSVGGTVEALAKVTPVGDKWDAIVRLSGTVQGDGLSLGLGGGVSLGLMRRVKDPY